jgi:hypothetical protein
LRGFGVRVLPMAHWSPQMRSFQRLSRAVLLMTMAIWSPTGKSPVAGHCSMAISHGASWYCGRASIASGTPSLQALDCGCRPTGNYYWFVRLRHRGKHRRITLGRADELDAGVARAQARRLLAEVALDGLPKRAVVKATPILSDFVETYWEDLARHWKPSTAARNQSAWRLYLKPAFGAIRVADITPADIHRWRDACAGLQ